MFLGKIDGFLSGNYLSILKDTVDYCYPFPSIQQFFYV